MTLNKNATHSDWTFFTNHAHVLILLEKNELGTVREMALEVGITERSVIGIINDLEKAGFLEKNKVGRQNIYKLNLNRPLRHKIEEHITVKQLIKLIND